MRTASRAIVFAMLLASACSPGRTAYDAAEGSYVAAGTEIEVQLTTPIGTSFSLPGQPFDARVIGAVHAPGGAVVIPDGASVRGRVVAVGAPPQPSLDLAFERVETRGGPAPLWASVVSRGLDAARLRAEPVHASPGLYASVVRPSAPALARAAGGGPPETNVSLPAGMRLTLVLMKPIVP
jgi:hypothetical protein